MIPLPEALAMFPDSEPIPDQPCWVEAMPANLHAVLTRTAVVGPDGDRQLVRLEAVAVDLSELLWRPKPIEGSRAWTLRRAASARGRANSRMSR